MDYIIVTQNKVTLKIKLGDIFYIGTADKPHVLKIVTEDDCYEIYGKLKEIQAQASTIFTRCHKKYLVNLTHVKGINKEEQEIVFTTSKVDSIKCSRRCLKEVMQIWKNL
ncbi:LytR/AlgR family response regulator transcription factor [Streptococcus gallolyticus]|uniref:LytTr DNA-binding domain-containing protein n=1 Tax=Streptococcus gallolyticus TaxID=315405 RepID=A0A1H9V0V4_9STRE|nr:LytTR family transcriptional regulator DNA-binding domain-containing protein [Streptococcus gallolyticus]SES15248.1 LytTr DNA-binding domain-containing protein [Streptococcus gallolyticus]